MTVNEGVQDFGGYPRRDQFFAHRVVRLMAKTCAAQQIGADACWLVTLIAHLEDSRRYKAPIRFYNAQLVPVGGFANEKALIRARRRAIDAGWLRYIPGAKMRPGVYWTAIPAEADLPDTPIDEDVDGCSGDSQSKSTEDEQDSLSKPAAKTAGNDRESGCLLYPIPKPTSDSEPSQAKTSNPGEAAPGFDPFPCLGNGKTWVLPAVKLAEWSETYKELDVPEELRVARQWLIDNPSKRKTSATMGRFLNGWLGRSRGSLSPTGCKSTSMEDSIYKPLKPA